VPAAPIVAAVFETAARSPEKDALSCGGERVSYETLRGRIMAAAGFLLSQGVRRGDRVILQARGIRPNFIYGYLACHCVGAIAVPVEAGITKDALARIAALTQARLAVLHGSAEMEALDSMNKVAVVPSAVDLDDPADILFTGGTTGRPKGVVQTHRNILAFAAGRAAVVGPPSQDRLVLPLPLSHGYGLSRLRATLLGGGAVIHLDGFLAPGDVFRALDDDGANALCCVPYGFAALFELAGDELGAYQDRLRYIETATAPLPAAHRDRLLALLPRTRIFNAYGMTETTSSIAYVDLQSERGKADSSGRPVPGVELRIVDGRVMVRGAGVMKGYWEDDAATRAVLADGWYAANDLGSLDADGFLYLGGRPEELINVGGLKVAPAEVENILKGHPAVSDCACAAVPDPSGLTGERVKAWLVSSGASKPSDSELLGWLRDRLESYKLPARFAWVDALPRTALGKLNRNELRARS
jgi:long-chain acyl-CoA synthetase